MARRGVAWLGAAGLGKARFINTENSRSYGAVYPSLNMAGLG